MWLTTAVAVVLTASVAIGTSASSAAEGEPAVDVAALVAGAEATGDPAADFVVAVTDDGSLRIETVADPGEVARLADEASDDGERVVAVSKDETAYALDWRAGDQPTDPNAPYIPWRADMHLQDVWPTTGGDGVVVAVLDTGVDTTHPDLAGRTLPGRTFFSGTGTGTPGCSSDSGYHGTHVAGIVAAAADTGHVYGVAPAAQILPVCVLNGNSGYFSDVAAGIVWATDQGADIINMSLGATGMTSDGVMDSAMAYAASHDVLIVASAGNNGSTVPAEPNYPAHNDLTIAVAAAGTTYCYGSGVIAPFSNRYPGVVDLTAAGSCIYSTVPTSYDASRVGSLSGTSMSAPAVSGAAALLRSALPGYSAAQIRSIMESTAEDRGTAGRDDTWGHGMVRPDLALDAAANNPPPITSTTTPAPTTSAPATTVPAPTTTQPSTTTTVAPPPPATPEGARLNMVPSRRVYDSRSGWPLQAGGIVSIDTGLPGVAAAVNLTAIAGPAGGYLSAYAPAPGSSCSATPVPDTSSLNYVAHDIRAAASLVNIVDGVLCVYSSSATDVLVDVSGYLGDRDDGAGLVIEEPRRLADTRRGLRVGGDQVLTVVLPRLTAAAQLNLTAVGPSAEAYLTVYPSRGGICLAGDRPDVSNLNVPAGAVRPNTVIADASNGVICVYSSEPTHVLVDLTATFDQGSTVGFFPIESRRVLDSRRTGSRVAARTSATGSYAGSDDVVAVQANITAVGSDLGGYVTAHQCNRFPADTSNVNFVAGEVSPNGGAFAVSGRTLCLYTSAQVHLLLDLSGVWR